RPIELGDFASYDLDKATWKGRVEGWGNPCEGLSSNRIRGFCQLGFGQDHMGRSGIGLGYYSGVLQEHRKAGMIGLRTRMNKLLNKNKKHITATWLRSRRFPQLIQAPIQSQWNSNTYLVETDDSNVIPDSPGMCKDDIQNEQNDVESDDERVALAN
nr:hypothetical protein [Tanacetum cinerariifolium]